MEIIKNLYILGGSPCCGKSTLAEIISQEYGYTYFKLDDHLDEYMQRGSEQGKAMLTRILSLSADEVWLRPPKEQNMEELEIYQQIFEYAIKDLKALYSDTPIITEGAGFLPEMVASIGVDQEHYMCIVPEPKFQYEKYQQREWVPYVLKDCTQKERAFANWMERDVLFAQSVRQDAIRLGYRTMIVDGRQSVKENLSEVEKVFKLNKEVK